MYCESNGGLGTRFLWCSRVAWVALLAMLHRNAKGCMGLHGVQGWWLLSVSRLLVYVSVIMSHHVLVKQCIVIHSA